MLSCVGPISDIARSKQRRGELGHALRVVDVALVLGELLEHRQLVGFLEAAQAHAHGAGLGRDDDDRAVRPVGRGDRGHAVADAGAVLPDHHAVAAADARIAVGHVAGALLVHDRDQADAGRREDVHRVHEGRAHDAEHVGHAVGDQGLDEGLGRRHLLHAGDGGADRRPAACLLMCDPPSGRADWQSVENRNVSFREFVIGRTTIGRVTHFVNECSEIRNALYRFFGTRAYASRRP